ncbi:ABC transporter ATP-binding protein [Paenibacillus polymyxa]|uniref:ABC transporter ATP-binding protein n=1 Tax=Paenibacillus polymyxa TaxID=1406 RepID=UPI000EDC01DE|nr:ABC transporter ATP-binding protein [Paenibacillus polymyxa]RGL30980.1 ABC transporter ATP-binding protein [Paenibacillus polymyxa]UMR33511.1 ABC transporter ATP-binding protein/permease [Paenibacillus polymyxa]
MQPKTGIARLLQIAGEKRGLLAVSALFSGLSAIFMLVPYASVYFVLKELLEHATQPTTADGLLMIQWGLIALAGLLASLITMYIGGLISHIAAFRILYGLRVKLSAHIGKLPLGWLNGTSTGAVKKTLEQNVEKVEMFVAHQLPDLVQVIVTAVVMIVTMFSLNIWLAFACIVPILLAFTVQMRLIGGSKTQDNIKEYYNSLERLNGSAVQYVRGIPAIKVFGQTVHSFRKFYSDMVHYREYCMRFTDQFETGFLVFKVIIGSFAAFVLPVGVYLLSGNPQNVAFASVLLFFLVMAPGVSAPMFKIMHLMSSMRDINEGVDRIDRIFKEPAIQEPAHPQKPTTYDVQFEQVSFSYGNTEEVNKHEDGDDNQSTYVLSNITFTARQGKMTALVGPSGSGKSTIANLVPRFWDVQKGAVRIGGADIRLMSTSNLMDTVAFVFQETFLFYDSVFNNIAVGDAKASMEQVIAAAKAAQCHEFICKLPNGYDTLIGAGGVYLSGGEEQRLAVARAILKNAPILVLDEATAFADPENEYEMQLALKELMKNKTVIVIAHRLSTIQHADQILVLQEGRIAERGQHSELLEVNGLYAHLWQDYTDVGQWQIGAREEEAAQ